MASCRRVGAIEGGGRSRSSTSSTRRWCACVHATKSGASADTAKQHCGGAARVAHGLFTAAVQSAELLQHARLEYFHLLLAVLERALAIVQQRGAALVSSERLLERQLARLHAGDDGLQFSQRLLEAAGHS